MIKFHIVTLGCSKNTADSEYVANFLQNAGLKWTDKPNEADLLMLNTCGFINDAKEQSLNTLFTLAEYKEKNKAQKLLVYGCLVKRYEEQLKADIPEIDYFFKFFDDKSLSLLLKELTVSKAPKKNCADFSAITKRFFTPPHIGLLKIAEGCDNWCSYCAIPKIRGSFRSLPEEEILKTAEKWVGRELELMADAVENGKILARTVYDAYEVDNQTILEDTGNIKPGDIFKGVITEAGLYDFKARPLK